jgi:hypothetical protein
MTENTPDLDGALEGFDEGRRATLKRLIQSGAFVAPVVVSFAMADLSVDAFMHAASANGTTLPATTTTAAPGTTTTTPAPGHPTKS